MKCKFCNKECYSIDHGFSNVNSAFVCANHEEMVITYWEGPDLEDITFFIGEYEISFFIHFFDAENDYSTALYQHEVLNEPNYIVYDNIHIDDILYKTMGFKNDKCSTKRIVLVNFDFGLTPDNVRFYIDKLLKMRVFS